MSNIACTIKVNSYSTYEAWLDHFATLDINNPKFTNKFIKSEIRIKGRSATTEERISLLQTILQELTDQSEAYGFEKEDIDALTGKINELINYYTISYNSEVQAEKVVNNPRFKAEELKKKFKSPFNVSNNLGQFIPIFSTKINAYVVSTLCAKLKNACIWDRYHGLVIKNDVDLTISLNAIKGEYIQVLQEWAGNNIEFSSIGIEMTKQDLDNYRQLLENSWNKIKDYLEDTKDIVSLEITDKSLQSIINPITAFYMLQNFDTIVEIFLSDFVVINPDTKNQVVSHSDKYKRRKRERKKFSWAGDLESSDGENLSDNFLKEFVTSIQVEGRSLPASFVQTISVKARDWYENTIDLNSDLTQDSSNIDAREIIRELLINDSLYIEKKKANLITLLQTNCKLTQELGLSRCKALASALAEYDNAYQAAYKDASISERATMAKEIDVVAKLLNVFTKEGNIGLVQTRDSNKVQYIQSGYKKTSKEGVKKQFKLALENLLINEGFDYFAEGLMIGNTSADWLLQIEAPATRRYLSIITGLDFNNDDLIRRFKGSPLTITKFIREYRRIVREVKQSGTEKAKWIQKILDKLSMQGEYIAFSNYIIKENDYELERMFDAEGKEQPKTTITTLTTQTSRAIDRFSKAGFNTQTNILTTNQNFDWLAQDPNIEISLDSKTETSGSKLIRRQAVSWDNNVVIPKGDFIQHLSYAGDVEVGGKSTKWVDLTERQLAETWINSLYINSIVKKQVASFQLDAASDKPKVPISSIFADMNLIGMSLDQLLNIAWRQKCEYYNTVENQIIAKWKTLFPEIDNIWKNLDQQSIEKVLNIHSEGYTKQAVQLWQLQFLFEENPILFSLDNVQKRLIEIQKTNPTFIFQQQIDYIPKKIKDKNGKDFYTVEMNNCLMEEINNSLYFTTFMGRIKYASARTLANMTEYAPKIVFPEWGSLNAEEKERLKALLNVESDKEAQETIKILQQPLDRNNNIQRKFFDKWFVLFNLVREADSQLFHKHYWTHGKNDDSIIDEETGRINKSKKRNNALSATWSPLQQGLKYGVPSYIRTATIESLTFQAFNHFGDSEQLNVHDGAIFTSYILRLLERYSSPDVEVSNSSKIIALQQQGAGFEQIKCADYAMTNAWIRNTIKAGQGTSQYLDGKILMRKMLEPAKLGESFYIAWKEELKKPDTPKNLFDFLGINAPIMYFNGRAAILRTFQPAVNSDNAIHMYWEYLDSETQVDHKIVAATLGVTMHQEGAFKCETLYDLWCLLGAENSSVLQDDGKIEFSDVSQEAVALLMCEFAPELKSQMIGKIIEEQASKSTMQFKNSRKDVFGNSPLITGTLDTFSYGVQQDSSHLSEEDHISSLTQVINAIALNGENPMLAQQMYELLGEITAKAIVELTDNATVSNKTDFYIKLGKAIGNELSRNKVVSNASAIITEALQKILPSISEFAEVGLPMSNNQLYHFITSELLSKLNRIIKQKFAGTAVVQNPAQGIMGIYTDNQGITYTRSELLKKAFVWYKDQINTGKLPEGLKYDEITNLYLQENSNFQKKQLRIDNIYSLNIGDVCEDKNGTIITIEDPQTLWKIQKKCENGEEIYQVYNLQKNLATSNRSWSAEYTLDEQGNPVYSVGSNFWLMESTKQLVHYATLEQERKKTKKGLTTEEKNNRDFIMSWQKDNMKALKEKRGYYKTLKDYKAKALTYVQGFKIKRGEEVLPKYYKTRLGLTGSLADIKLQGSKYFETLLKERLQYNKAINIHPLVTKGHENSFVVTTNNVDIVFTSNNEIQTVSNVWTEKYGTKTRIITEDGVMIDDIDLPNTDMTISYKPNQKGKAQIYINIKNPAYLNSSWDIQTLIDCVNGKNGVFKLKGVDSPVWKDKNLAREISETQMKLKDKNYLVSEAEAIYNSFLLTLNTISARIPSQSFQSFLSNETVAFTEDDENNGYMNIWEMWFQGSDYDIDKAYTLIYALDKNGKIPGHVFTDYSSPETLFESLTLPKLDPSIRIFPVNTKGVTKGEAVLDLTPALIQYANKEITIKQLLEIVRDSNKKDFVYQNIVEETSVLNVKTEIDYTDTFTKIVADIITYKRAEYSADFYKNSIMAAISYASADVANLKASEVPMASAYVNSRIDNSVKQIAGENEIVYINEDPTHIINFQFQAAIGKKGVGISANAIKATGSIQQRANILHQTQQLPDFNIDLDFPIYKKDGEQEYTYTISEKLRHIPNTKISFEQFKNFYSFSGEEKHPLAAIYEALKNNAVVQTHSDKEKRFVDAFEKTKKYNQKMSFEQVLYQMYLDEENTADMISIFISLCTDNAKELQLYRIAGTPELLNIPLSLISIGMTVQDVTDICVQYLVPLLKDLNVGIGDKKKNIQDILKKKSEESGPLSKGYASLLKVTGVAEEMRTITSYFKVNQGTSVRYAEVLDFLYKLDDLISKINQFSNGALTATMAELLEDSEEATQLRQKYIQAYTDNFKTAFNIFDIIFNSNHYFEQLRAVYNMVQVIENNIAVAHVSSDIFKKCKKQDLDISSTRITQIVQNVCFGNALQSMPDIIFSKDMTEIKYGNWDSELPGNMYLGVGSEIQIKNLLSFIEKGLIPYLKTHFKNNAFVDGLVMDTFNQRYTVPFNSYESKADLRIKGEINRFIFAFSQISKLSSGLETIHGETITIGDLFQMYASITNLNRTNTMSAIIHAGTTEVSRLNFQGRLSNYYAELDRLTGIATSSTNVETPVQAHAKKQLENLINQAYNYTQAVAHEGVFEIQEGSQVLVYKVDLEDRTSIYSMVPGYIKSDLSIQCTNDNISTLLQAMLQSLHTGCDLQKAEIENTNSIKFTVNIPNKIGKPIQRTFRFPLNTGQTLNPERLRQLQKQISLNIQSVYNNIQQLKRSGTLYENLLLSDLQEIDFNGILEKVQEKYSDDPIYEQLNNWIKSNRFNIFLLQDGDYLRSHIEKLGSENLIVLSKSDFLTSDIEKQIALLLNLMCDMEIKEMPSENSRFKVLLGKLGIEKGFLHNLTAALRQKNVQEVAKTSPLLKSYLSTLLEFSVEDDVKTAAYKTFNELENALLNEEFYFQDISNVPVTNTQIGDILEYVTDRYIVVGKTLEGKLILVNISKENLGKVKLEYNVTTNKGYKVIKRVKLFSNTSKHLYKFITPTEDSQKENKGETKLKYMSELSTGDYIQIKDTWYLITDILYNNEQGNYEREFLTLDSKGEVSLLSSQILPSIQKYCIKQPEFLDQQSSQLITITNFDKIADDIKLKILKKLYSGNKVIYKRGDQDAEAYIKRVGSDYVITYSNEVIPAQFITGVSYSTYDVFEYDPVIAYAKQQYIRRKGKNYSLSLNYNQNSDNFELSQEVQVQKLNRSSLEFQASSRRLFLDPNVTKVSKEYNEIEKGDYIVSNNNDFYYHVLQVDTNNNQALVSYFTTNKEYKKDNGEIQKGVAYELEVVDISTLKSTEGTSLYKNIETYHPVIKTGKGVQELSPGDKCRILLENLGKTFGTQVIIDSYPDISEFAFIDNGTVVINTAKMGNQKLEHYILSQGIHEFTHLALVALRAKDPDTYAKLIASVEKLQNTELDANDHYNTSKTKTIEEYIVRAVSDRVTGIVSASETQFDADILETIKEQIKEMLTGENLLQLKSGINVGEKSEFFKTIGTALNSISDFSLKTRDITLDNLRAKALSEQILDNLKYKCE